MRALATWSALALVAPLALAALAAPGGAIDSSCGSPLGEEAAARVNLVLEPRADVEYATLDALRMPGAQRSPAVMLEAWGRLVLVAEAKVDQGTNFTWGVFVRVHSNVTGWNTTPLWLSSPNTSQPYPPGVHIRPSAAMLGGRLWVAWDAQGSHLGAAADRMILMRSVGPDGSVSPALRASATDVNATTQHPILLASGAGLVLVYSTSDGDAPVGDTHIVARTFDGAAFGPTVAVSNLSDGWADALPALASDAAGRTFAAWTATNPSGTSSRLMFAHTQGGPWSTPVALAELGASPSAAPALAHAWGRVFIAYSSSHAPDLNGTDSDVFWRIFDPANATLSPAERVSPDPSKGDDTAPTLAAVGGLVYLGWGTNEDFYYAAGVEPDAVFRTFDGALFGAVTVASDPAPGNIHGSPSFFTVGTHLYAHWMLTPPPSPGAPRGDSREALRLVLREPQWYDGIRFEYEFKAVAENGSSLLEVKASQGALAAGHELVVRLPDQTRYPLLPSADGWSAWVLVEPSAADFEVLACGKPAQASPAAPPPPPPAPRFLPVGPDLAVAALGAAAAARWAARRGKR